MSVEIKFWSPLFLEFKSVLFEGTVKLSKLINEF